MGRIIDIEYRKGLKTFMEIFLDSVPKYTYNERSDMFCMAINKNGEWINISDFKRIIKGIQEQIDEFVKL